MSEIHPEGPVAITSLKEQVKAVADGFWSYNTANLRKYQPNELKDIQTAFAMLEREIRREQCTEGDYDAVKKKNFRLGNLRRNKLVVDTFIKTRRIRLE